MLQPPKIPALHAFWEVIPYASREKSMFMSLPRNFSQSTQPFRALSTQLQVYVTAVHMHFSYSWGPVLSEDVKTHTKNYFSWLKGALRHWKCYTQ